MTGNLENMVNQYSLDTIHLIATKNDVFTKIGGQPLAGKDFEWPKWQNKSLAFIMQIKLSEITLISKIKHFPQKGFLYFFYDKEQSTWGFDPKDKGSWKVIYQPEHNNLTLVPFPQDLENDYKYCEKKLEQELIKTYLSLEDERIEGLQLTDDQADWYVNFRDSVYNDDPKHQISGFANEEQGSYMDLECELVSNGLFCGDPSGYNDPKAKHLEQNRKDWTLLLQVDSDDEIGMMWGDMGKLYFWIKKDDLEKLIFENVWMILQCG